MRSRIPVVDLFKILLANEEFCIYYFFRVTLNYSLALLNSFGRILLSKLKLHAQQFLSNPVIPYAQEKQLMLGSFSLFTDF